MQRVIRPLLFVIAILLIVAASRSAEIPRGLFSRIDLQTAAPTGLIVLQLTPEATEADRARIGALAGAVVEPRFSAATLAAVTAKSRGPSPALAALARYGQIDAGGRDHDTLRRLVRRLAADPAVATAFLEPRAVPAALGFDAFTGAGPAPVPRERSGREPATPDFSGLQGYLADAPQGIGATAMASQPGARGGTVRIVDVEGAWLWAHEDLPDPFVDLGEHIDDLSWRNHGTAVMGEMRGSDNGFGVIGIVPDSQVGNSSIGNQSVAGALLSAAAHLDPGDLILIELHAPGPNSYEGGGQYGYLPMEFWPDNFDAIRAITDLGVIVTEAAGNGQQDLDDPIYQGLFRREVRDSGAIMIGATSGSSLDPAWFTNHGSRVDLAGWGSSVATCGYGDLQGGPETEWYTQGFSGTSSASPIVTGAVASLQGMVQAAYSLDLDAHLAALLLRNTGTPTNGPELIGPRPDLVGAWALAAQGIGQLTGTVIAGDTGLPLGDVVVEVMPDGPAVRTAADGTYRIGLLPNDYTLAFTSYYYEDRTDAVTVAVGVTIHNVSLSARPLEVLSGTVYGTDLIPLAGVHLQLLAEPIAAVWSQADGTFSLPPVPAGREHRLLAGGASGYGGRYQELPSGGNPGSLAVVLPLVTHDFETGPDGFQAQGGLWTHGNPTNGGVGPGRAFDGNLCWGVGLDGSGYPDEALAELWSPIYTSGQFAGDRLYLSFHYWCGTEAGYDGVNVVLDPEGSPTVVVPLNGYTDLFLSGLGYQAGWSGTTDGWQTAIFDLTPQLAQPSWRFALRFGSDVWVTDAGFLVDGVTLHVVDTAVAVAEPAIPAAAAAQITAWPNPFNPRVNVSWSLPAPTRLDLEIFDLRGRLVQRMLSNAAVPLQGHVTWNGTDLAGRALPSGAYLVRLQPEGQQALVQRITLVR